MVKRIYYFTLLIGFSLLFLQFILSTLYIFKDIEKILSVETVENIEISLYILILLVQIFRLKNPYKAICFGLFFIIPIGVVFVIQHWPWGKVLYFVPSFALVAILFSQVEKRKENIVSFLTLGLVLFELVSIFLIVNSSFPSSILFLIKNIFIGVILFFLISRLKRSTINVE
jgi:hypothetical protein